MPNDHKATTEDADFGQGSIEGLTDAELAAAAQGCREQTCLYHGHINQERARRQRVARLAACIHDHGCDDRSHSLPCNNKFYGGTR